MACHEHGGPSVGLLSFLACPHDGHLWPSLSQMQICLSLFWPSLQEIVKMKLGLNQDGMQSKKKSV